MCFLLEMKGYYTDMGGAICVLEARRVITGKRKFPQTYMLQIRKENSARQFWFFMSQTNIVLWVKLCVCMSVHDRPYTIGMHTVKTEEGVCFYPT